MTLLAAEALGFDDGHALEADFLERLFDVVQFERLDDGFDFLHRSTPLSTKHWRDFGSSWTAAHESER
jgi:hypothetical protein